jgi:hypothetical protein
LALPGYVSADSDILAVVDPETGGMMFPGRKPAAVFADFAYAMAADVGGGPYDRIDTLPVSDGETRVFVAAGSLAGTLKPWSGSGRDGLVRIAVSAIHSCEPAASVRIPAGRRLSLVADNGVCPTLVGSLTFIGEGPGAAVTLNGIRIDGTVTLQGQLAVHFEDCTIGPPGCHGGTGGIRADGGRERSLSLDLVRCISGPIEIRGEGAPVSLSDCIVDGGGGQAIGGPSGREAQPSVGPVARIVRSTVLGPVRLREVVEASDSLFSGEVTLQRRFSGYFRYCYLPLATNTAMRYRCQPPVALLKSGDWKGRQRGEAAAAPHFTSTRYGDPGYGQLAFDCPDAIRSGAENGSEIGAFSLVNAPRREAAIDGCLEEYLPYGMRAKVFYVT